MKLDLNTVYKQIVKIVKSAYKKACKMKNNKVEAKELNDIVTEVDKYMEKEIVGKISELYPNHSFVGEEFGESKHSSEYEWLIDPIDGTINYVAGIPFFGTSVALKRK